jgi:hypothetical protein
MEAMKNFRLDWRIAFGLALSFSWISAGLVYLLGIVGWTNFIHLPTADIGSFLEGAFAPLAFLWLVIGHFMQQAEISANTQAIKLQERSARRLEVHSQRDTYFKLLNLIQEQLGSIASFHYMSVKGPSGTGEMTTEEFAENRTKMNAGDHALFVRMITYETFNMRNDRSAIDDFYFGTEIRKRHTENFSLTFEKLLKAANEADTGEMISNALLYGSAVGRQYRIIRYVKGGDAGDLELFL